MVVGAWYGRALSLAGALCALVPALLMWGFTVDDALIPLRYAHHIALGLGYRFDAHGPSTDGVTPLPWAPLLAPLSAGGDLVVALERVKSLGVGAWTLAGAALGHALAKRAGGERSPTIHAVVALLIVALAFPIGAWAASGMETGIATALATLAAVSFERPRRAALLAGLAATVRPELVAWAVVVAVGAGIGDALAPRPAGSSDDREVLAVPSQDARMRIARVCVAQTAIAFTPFAACALVRLALFGRPSPLALIAKPSDLAHGWSYAGAATLVVLTPVLVFAPFALRRASAMAKTLAFAGAMHVAVVVAVGGDWMPYARLMVPVAPSLALVFVDVGRVAHIASNVTRAALAVVLGVVVGLRAAPAGRRVHEDRKALIASARPVLEGAHVVAALDIGWMGAATAERVVDLAGLTDPAIAVLPGGHTSKAVDLSMLLDRDVDTLVVYCAPRLVEQRLLASRFFPEKFELARTLAFGPGGAQCYRFYRRR